MTIFNWVHKKLRQNVAKDIDDVTKMEKKNKSEGISEIEKNTKAILDQVGLVDALDNWFDGVLTIGTFGFDTLKFEQEEEDIERGDDECENNVDLGYVVIDGSIIKNADQELVPLLVSSENTLYDHHGAFEVKVDIEHHFESIKTVETSVVVTAVETEIEPQKKRTTLAELFMEDHDGKNDDTWHGEKTKKTNLDEVKDYKQKGSKLSSKLRSAKKIKPKSKSEENQKDLRPIKKVHQMIKRMLNKKIHPDIDSSKALKKDVPYKTTQKCTEALESLHLLNVQDCMA